MRKQFLAFILTFAMFSTIFLPSKAMANELNEISGHTEDVMMGDILSPSQEDGIEDTPVSEVSTDVNIEQPADVKQENDFVGEENPSDDMDLIEEENPSDDMGLIEEGGNTQGEQSDSLMGVETPGPNSGVENSENQEEPAEGGSMRAFPLLLLNLR